MTNRVTIKQIDGDDGFCWCVLIDGKIKWDGMTKQEVKWRQKSELALLLLNRKEPSNRTLQRWASGK